MSITKKTSLINIAPKNTLLGFSRPLVADLNNDGRLDYLTTTTDIGSNIGDPLRLYLSNSQGIYKNKSELILDGFTSLWTQKILAADLNNDGLQDVIIGAAPEQNNSRTEDFTGTNTSNVSNWGSPQYVLFQNKDGTFSPVQTIASTFEAHSINVCDFNNDGLKDILYVSDIWGSGQTPRLLLNTGEKSFTNADLSNIIGSGSSANNFVTFYATTGDFNNDGNQDIVFLQGGYQNGAYTFLAIGDGKGGFEKGAQLPMVPESMGGEFATEEGDAVLDLNHDGYLDLMVWVINRKDGLGDLSPGHLQVLINNGHGQFTDQTTQWLGDFETTSIGANTRSLESYIPGTSLIPLNIMYPVKGSSNGYLHEPTFLHNTGSKLIPIYDPYWNQELSNGNGNNADVEWRLENGKVIGIYTDWNVDLVSVTLNAADELSYFKPHDPFVEINQDSRLANLNDGYAFSTAFYQPWRNPATPSYVQNMQRQLLQNTPGNRILIGTKDNDFISVGNAFAGTGNNVLIGNGGNDALIGGAGDDIFIPSGSSYIDGGGGNDTVVLNQNQSAYKVIMINDVYTATYGNTTYTIEGISYLRFVDKTLNLTTQAEITNSPLQNINYINDGFSILDVPNTTYIGNNGSNTLIINAKSANFSISETGSLKTLIDNTGNLGKEFLISIEKLQFTDQVLVIGALSIDGTSSKDKLLGTSDDEDIFGYAGNDSLTGLAGNDTLDGGAGNDTMMGGLGDDSYYVDATKDVVTEKSNQGIDTVISSISYTLGTNVEKLTLSGTSGLSGKGNTAANVIIGSSGNDTINGGLGNDTLTGGLGKDTFVFNTKLSATNVDTITDFTPGDRIALAGSIFNKLKGDKDLSDNLYVQSIVGISTQDTNDYLFYDLESGRLYYDADGSGAKASVQVAIIGTGGITLTANDFSIV